MTVGFLDLPPMSRTVEIVPGSINEEAGTVDVIASTGSTVRRYGWFDEFDERLVITEETVDLRRLNSGAPVLDTHSWYGGTNAIRGITVPGSARVVAGQVIETLKVDRDLVLDGAAVGAELWRKITSGFVRFLSIGYDARYKRTRAKDRTDGVNDVDLLESEHLDIYETSFVPAGADPGAAIRSAPQGATRRYAVRSREENAMTAPTQPATPTDKPDEAAIRAAVELANTQAIERMKVARAAAKVAGVTDDEVIEKVATECRSKDHAADLNAIKARFLDLAEREQQGRGPTAPQVTMGRDAKDKRGDAISLVFEHRMIVASGAKRSLPILGDEITQSYRRKRLVDICEELLVARGIATKHLSDVEIAELSLRDLSTSNFALLLADSGNKILLTPWETRKSPWLNFAKRRDLNDFKPTKLVRRSAAPKMERIKENGEIEFGSFGEKQESIQLDEYGIGVALGRKLIINDDLGAFGTGVLGLGDSVVDNRDDLMVGIIVGVDPITGEALVMEDGLPLFHANHNNIVGTTGAPSETLVELVAEGLGAQVATLPSTAKRTTNTRQMNMQLSGWFAAQKEGVALSKLMNPRFLPATAATSLSQEQSGLPVWWDNRLRTTPRYYYGMDVERSGLVYSGLQGQLNPRFSQAIRFTNNGIMLKVEDDFAGGLESYEWIQRVQV